MDLISVIVPVYKVEAYLDRCVESIVSQTYRNLEIILVDDGSPDNCPAICDGWAQKDGRIKVIHRENSGPSATRNAGIDTATGAYICFVDSDDWIHPRYVEFLHHACTEYQVPISGCDYFCVSDFVPFDDTLPCNCTLYNTEQALEQFIRGQLFRAVVWNKLYHRSILNDVRFPVGRNREDEFFSFQVLTQAPRLVYIDAPLYFYYQRPGSFMNSLSIHHLDALDAYLERMAFLKDHYPQLYERDKVQFCISCAMLYREVLKQEVPEKSQFKKKIMECRKQVSFDLYELCSCNVKQLVYIMGTGCCMDAFCKLLNLRARR